MNKMAIVFKVNSLTLNILYRFDWTLYGYSNCYDRTHAGESVGKYPWARWPSDPSHQYAIPRTREGCPRGAWTEGWWSQDLEHQQNKNNVSRDNHLDVILKKSNNISIILRNKSMETPFNL